MAKKRKRPPVVFIAPGAGLGHIVRVSAIALQLEEKEIPTLIVTTSGWAEGLGRITGLAMTVIPHEQWGADIGHYLKHVSPGVIVQDSFPFGFKHEDLSPLAEKIPFVYLARVLKIKHYLKACDKIWDDKSLLLSTIIKVEPLPGEQEKILNNNKNNIFKLDRRICFPFMDFIQKRPQALDALLDESKTHLVVHSGPVHETEMLIKKAKRRIQDEGEGTVAIINPASFQRRDHNAFDYFPAAALYSDAYHIYTGGGYNAIAEQDNYRGRVTRIPFDRYYDDQHFRIAMVSHKGQVCEVVDKKSTGVKPGAQQASEIIADVYEGS